MKTLDEQDHYEVLEVSRGARGDEIDAAYRVAQSTYSDGSLATYSVFDAADAEAISERIELAYRVLSDEATRSEYDDSLGLDKPANPSAREGAGVSSEEKPAPAVESPSDFEAFDGLDHAGPEDEDGFEGARLRRQRLRRGIELEQISEITKISPNYLRCIEEEAYADLPAEVYARGFVTAYVQTIGGDPDRIVPDFVAKYRELRGGKHKSFLRPGT